MKIRLIILIIFSSIFSSCSDFSGNEDAVESSLKPTPVTTTTNNNDDDDDTATRTYYDLNGVAYGNNTFVAVGDDGTCLLYTSPSPRDATLSRMPSSA